MGLRWVGRDMLEALQLVLCLILRKQTPFGARWWGVVLPPARRFAPKLGVITCISPSGILQSFWGSLLSYPEKS